MNKIIEILIKEETLTAWLKESIYDVSDKRGYGMEFFSNCLYTPSEEVKIVKGKYKHGLIITIDVPCSVGIYHKRFMNRLRFKVGGYDSLADKLTLISNEVLEYEGK